MSQRNHARWWGVGWVYVSTRAAGRMKSLVFSLSTERVKTGGSGCGGLSVLKKSHVVSESGQLLLIWNQRDRGRICWRRETRRRRSWVRGRFLLCQMLSIFLHPFSFSSLSPHARTLKLSSFELDLLSTSRSELKTIPHLLNNNYLPGQHNFFTSILNRIVSGVRSTTKRANKN